jgi:hypothetical protein
MNVEDPDGHCLRIGSQVIDEGNDGVPANETL